MMAGRRSARSKSKIDYSKFGVDDDFDDDFADMTPPVSKKLKTGNENKENNLKKKVTASVHEKKKKERISLDEKIYERELQAALELSINESQSSPTTVDESTENISAEPVKDVKQERTFSETPDDDIIVLDKEDKEETDTDSKQRSTTTKKPVIDDDGSDFNAFSEDESNDDDDDDEDYQDDSDFEGYKKKKPKGKSKEKTKKQTTPKSKQKPTKQISPVKSKPKTPVTTKQKISTVTPKVSTVAGVSHTSLTSPSYRSPAGSSDNRKWIPPGISSASAGKSPLGGVSLKSPSSGLRVGLSRHQKLKPLHPTLKIHN